MIPAGLTLGQQFTTSILAYYTSRDEQDLGKLFERLYPFLLRYARTQLFVYCAEQRADLVQVTLVRILQALRDHKMQPPMQDDGTPGSCLPWLKHLLRNCFYDEFNKSQVNPCRPNLEHFPMLIQAPDTTASEDACEAVDLLHGAMQVIQAMPKRQQQCFRLYYLEGQQYAAAAQQMGITQGCFKSTLNRALTTLRTWAASQPAPTQAIYGAYTALPTHELFGDGPAHKSAGRGFYSNKSLEEKARKRRREIEQNSPKKPLGRPPKPLPLAA